MAFVEYSYDNGLARITLSAPERGNLMDTAMVGQLLGCVKRAAADDARVVLLSAEGKSFCVGGDVNAFHGDADPAGYVDDLADTLHRALADLQDLNAVCVSVVRGTAAGSGVPLANAADLVLAAESAKFTLGYTKIGLSPDGGSSLLAASVGLHRALRFALLNPVVTASEALAMGLVSEVHPDDDLDAAAARVVDAMLAGSRGALVAAKRLIRAQATPNPVSARRAEAVAIRAAIDSPDGIEGAAAFVEKRRPRFG